ncbi:MAG: cardiolipin synthase ClsB [Pseudomonadota bacterium]
MKTDSYPWREGNRVQLLENGEAFFPRVFAAIEAAKHEVLLETFILFEDKVGKQLQRVLIAAAQRGVRIEMTVDGFGSSELTSEFITDLTSVGVRLRMFDPGTKVGGMRLNIFRRLHRKILVVDGGLAFIGGINFSADHLADYGPEAKQDYAVEVEGPVVRDIHRFALEALATPEPSRSKWWHRDEQQPGQPPELHPKGSARTLFVTRDNQEHRKDIEEHYLEAIRAARTRIVIANAYFFPGYRLLRELRNAARRGVQVQLILQGEPDMPVVKVLARMLYNYLLRDGVQVSEYCQRPLHGKVALVDYDWSTVGSSNLDPLSLALNLEANLLIRDPVFNRELKQRLDLLVEHHCKSISLERMVRGYFWRAPLIFLCFHFLRTFPAMAGWLPAHRPRLAPLHDELPIPDDERLAPENANEPH